MMHYRCRIPGRTPFLFLLLFGLIACTSDSEKKRRELLEAQPVLNTFSLEGPSPVSVELHQNLSRNRSVASNAIGELAVTNSGDIILYDTHRQKVYLYPVNRQPKELSRLGTEPGEFRQLLHMSQCGERLFILDGIGPEMDIISLNEDQNSSISLAEITAGYRPSKLQCLDESRLLLRSQRSLSDGAQEVRFMLIDEQATVIDPELSTFQKNAMSADVSGEVAVFFDLPTDRKLSSAVSSDRIYFNNGDQLLIPVYDKEGEYSESWYYPFENLSVNRQDVIEEYTDAKMRRAMRGEDLPDDWPAADDMLTDASGNIWISVIRSDHRQREWIGMDSSGRPIQAVLLPREAKVKAVLDDKLYILMYNPRTFRDEIRIYTTE